MMVVAVPLEAGVQREAGLAGEAIQEMGDEAGGELSHSGREERGRDLREAAPAQVEGDGGQRLVHGHDDGAEALDALAIGKGLIEGPSQGDGDVLCQMVRIHLDIASGSEVEVEQTMEGELAQQVVEDADAGVDAGLAAAVEV